MRRGFATLLFVTLTVSAFVNPWVVPSRPQPGTLPPLVFGQTTAGYDNQLAQASSLGVCKVEADPLCSKCSPTQICPTKELLETIGDFFGPGDKDKDGQFALNELCGDADKSLKQTGVRGPSGAASRRVWGVPTEFAGTLRSVLAIVPDPAHTHLSLFFDRQIEAIQQAAQEDGYNFARAFMPWDPKDHQESTDLRIRLQQSEYSRNREGVPGLLIFRKTAPKDLCAKAAAPLFIFVVGETPTGGVNKRQFVMALQVIKEIRDSGGASSTPLYIMGPTFAGSLYSLKFLLRQVPKNSFSHTLIHSGTVSSLKTLQWFKDKEPSLRFRTFQESDCYALAQLTGLLEREHYAARDITLLSEDESAYGEETCVGSSDVVQIHFPRDISALRSAYQHDMREGESSASKANAPVRSTLRSNLEDNGSDDDSVPPYSRLQTPLSEEAVLMGIISTLQKHHAHFVVIQATNPLDALFMGRYLRNAYPQGRVITIGADLRFPREMEDPRLRGILALTPYSLLPGSDDHTASPSGVPQELHTHRVFPSSLSVGSYNAMLSLLRCDPFDPLAGSPPPATAALDEKPPCQDLPIVHYANYGWPILARNGMPNNSDALVAPLWLTALGGNGYWPLAILNGTTPPSVLEKLKASPAWPEDKISSPLPWKTVFWLGIATAMSFLFQMWKGSVGARSDTSAKFAPFKVPARNVVFFVTDLLLLLMLLALSWPWVLWGFKFTPARWFVWLVIAIMAVISVGYIDLRRRGAIILCRWFLIISVVACIVSCVLARSGSPLTQNFMMYRLVHITSGVSPLLPLLLLLAAGLWWAWYTLEGLALLDKRRPRLPRIEDLKLPSEEGSRHSRTQAALNQVSREENLNITRMMKPNSWDVRLYAPPTVFLLLVATAVEIWHPVDSLEGHFYDIAYGWLLGIVVFVLILGLSRVVLLWLELRNLLIYLDQFPLRRSFERLEGFTWKPIWRLGGGALQDSYRLLWRQFDSLDHLWNERTGDKRLDSAVETVRNYRDEVAANLEKLIADEKKLLTDQEQEKKEANKSPRNVLRKVLKFLKNLLKDSFKPQAGWVKQWAEQFECLQRQLATTCGVALQYLSRVWEAEKKVDMFEVSRKGKDAPPAKPPEEDPKTQLAEQFVCLFYLNFILTVIFRMRTLVMSAAGIYVLALFSFSSYPFEPRSSFHVLMVVLFLLIIGVVGIVLAQMHRDGTLSRITDTVPGELGVDFWFRLAIFVAVPLLSLLAAQFPEIGGTLFSWVEPLEAFK